MSKTLKASLAAIAAFSALAAASALPAQASAPQPQANGITNCDAPGGRQAAGALIGAVVGGVVGNNLARNERTAGTLVGAGAGAAAGSYIGCNQQRTRALSVQAGGDYRALANLNVRSGPGTRYRTVSRLSAGQPFSAIGSQGEWVQIAGGGWVSARYVGTN